MSSWTPTAAFVLRRDWIDLGVPAPRPLAHLPAGAIDAIRAHRRDSEPARAAIRYVSGLREVEILARDERTACGLSTSDLGWRAFPRGRKGPKCPTCIGLLYEAANPPA